MCKRVYLKAKDAEKEMQEARKADGFIGKTEKMLIANMVKAARNNSRVGDKLLMVVCNEDAGSSKSKKAHELGVPVITEEELITMLSC